MPNHATRNEGKYGVVRFWFLESHLQVDLEMRFKILAHSRHTNREKGDPLCEPEDWGYSSVEELPNSLNFVSMVGLPLVNALMVILFAASEVAPR